MKIKRKFPLVIGFALALVAGSLWWRRESRRRNLPCPAWLGWLLENPLMDRFAGTQTTLDRIGLQPGERGLDIGAGPGRIAIPAAQRLGPEGKLVAVDIQPAMLERLCARVEKEGLTNLETRLFDITTPNVLEQEVYDRAWLVTVLGEIPDREAALRNIYWALRPRGTLSITEILPDPHYQSLQTVLRFAKSAGFQPSGHWGTFLSYTQNFTKPKT
jgi:ubiquinone/menaquinone biosynthesis C-methylase UbiE